MTKITNMKLLIVIPAALAAISAVLLNHEHHVEQQTRQAQIAERVRKDDAEYREQEDFRKQVEALKAKSHAYAGNESKTWNSKP
jgi:dethiobiotin synthetase